MFFSPFSFEPADGLRDTDAFPTVPAGETDARNQFQVLFDQLKAYVNQLTGALNASDEGASGADRIAATPLPDLPKEGAATVQGQLNALWDAVERNVAYSLNDNTLTNAKLEPDIKVGSLASLEGVLPNASVTEALLNLARLCQIQIGAGKQKRHAPPRGIHRKRQFYSSHYGPLPHHLCGRRRGRLHGQRLRRGRGWRLCHRHCAFAGG